MWEQTSFENRVLEDEKRRTACVDVYERKDRTELGSLKFVQDIAMLVELVGNRWWATLHLARDGLEMNNWSCC